MAKRVVKISRHEPNGRPARSGRTCLTTPARIILPVVLSLAACDEVPTDRTHRFTERDSAGVTVVHNQREGWTATAVIDAEHALFTIGQERADPSELLHQVTELRITPDGGIVIANSGNHEVVAYGPAGSPKWRIGREGEGPGEFRGDLSLHPVRGDTLVIFDWLLRRSTAVDPEGRVLDVRVMPDWLPNTELEGTLSDGRHVISSRHLALGPGLNQDSVAFHVTSSNDEDVIEAFAAASKTPVILWQDQGPPVVDAQPLGPNTTTALEEERLYVALGDRPEVRSVRPDGGVDLIVRWNVPPRPLMKEIRRRWEGWDLEERSPQQRPARRRWLDAAEYPDALPVTRAIVVSEGGGEIWVGRFRLPWEAVSLWDVFGPDGRWRQTVALPGNLEVRAVTASRLAAIETDPLGVERVKVLER